MFTFLAFIPLSRIAFFHYEIEWIILFRIPIKPKFLAATCFIQWIVANMFKAMHWIQFEVDVHNAQCVDE